MEVVHVNYFNIQFYIYVGIHIHALINLSNYIHTNIQYQKKTLIVLKYARRD